MWPMLVCIPLVLVGLAMIVRWAAWRSSHRPTPAQDAADPTGRPPVSLVPAPLPLVPHVGDRRRRQRRHPQGQITEAEQVVGRISVEGTLGFIVFTGLFFGAPWPAG
jgi:hypothetical protein